MRTGRMRRRPAWLLPERWIPMQLTMRLQPIQNRRCARHPWPDRRTRGGGGHDRLPACRPRAIRSRRERPDRVRLEATSTANPDGTDVVGIASGSDIDGRPVWSHIGSKVAFFRWSSTSATTADLMVLDVATGRVVRITNGAVQLSVPSWSPDDQMQRSRRTARMDRRCTPRVLTVLSRPRLDALGVAEAPVWSPDGVRIAYVVPSGFAYELYVADADGTDARPLTGTYGALANGFSHGEMSLAWSPDGRRILFAAGAAEGSTHLYVVDAAGDSPEKQLTFGSGTEYGATGPRTETGWLTSHRSRSPTET